MQSTNSLQSILKTRIWLLWLFAAAITLSIAVPFHVVHFVPQTDLLRPAWNSVKITQDSTDIVLC